MKRFLWVLLFSVLLGSLAFASPLLEDLRQIKSFEYKVTTPEGSFFYGASIERQGSNYQLTTWGKQLLPAGDEITLDDVFSTSYGNWFMLFLNPMFNAAMEMIDMDNPQTLSYFGMQVKYEGQERVNQWTGSKFTLYTGSEPAISWVINDDIQMSIKTTMHEENLVMELVSFQK
ncbi:MAG TPA: hypothetical protein P5560_13375 [Thermotogota bacterium]|nr:hypothetical protein [Thermotogota bacterium]HRW93937.1 hypothetical protein [Thermotogota bacterium]